MTDLSALAIRWRQHKLEEKRHAEERRKLEDEMAKLLALPADLDETRKVDLDEGATLKVVGRLDRKVDADKVQEIAAEHGIEGHLSSLFRWKPEINMRAWNAAPESVTRVLSQAVTTKPGRPSFSVTFANEEE